ncbi:hypothetical protein GGI17_004145 [Coemansia sp. S146]|nr:hypothetical protein GGI17_004145 [Coemansia sp. S146]
MYRLSAILLGLAQVCLAAGPVILGYYPSWKRAKMDGVDFSKYTHINIAFGIPLQDGTFNFEDQWALPQILSQVHGGGAKALLSIGGWTGSNFFSDIMKNDGTRNTMLTSMVNYVNNNNLDGIDIDWEYPGRQGNTCNVYDAQNDMPNFLKFLQDLRGKFDASFGPSNKLITLAVRAQPFDIYNSPSNDVSAFAKVVDYANIMAYDINGPWMSDTGPNAPFNYEAGKGTPLSLVSAIDAWTGAGWPAKQLVAGLGFYGRSTVAQQDMTRDMQNQYQPQLHEVPLGDSEDAPWYDACARSTSASGTWQWKSLRGQGVLTSPRFPSAPWIRQWDGVTQTPWLFNPSTKIFLSYDDPDSIRIKSDYAASRGLGGVMIWSVNMDHNSELVDAARSFGSKGAANGTTITPTVAIRPILTSIVSSTHTKTMTAEPVQSSTAGASGPQPSSQASSGSLVAGEQCNFVGYKINSVYAFATMAISLASSVFGGPVIMGYYPSWKRAQSANVDWSKYTHVNMAFGIPTSSGTFSFDGDWFLPALVTSMHSAGTKVLMSVGGWTGSNYFSAIMKDTGARSTMITSMVNYVKANNLDGIDIDWEYPGRLGDNCNVFDVVNDTPNYLAFLQDLRAALTAAFGAGQKLITLAVRVQPFEVNSVPLTDVSAFAKVVDYANLMQYDINGGWNNVTGPNAPLNFQQGQGLQVSFVSAINDWVGAGFPANQLTAGIGFYGRSTIALQDMTKDPANQYQPQSQLVPLGDSEDAPWYDVCAGSTANSGVWQWKHLRDQGVLTSPATAAAPWVRQWDSVSQTPWLFNPSTKQFISYDDPQSLQIKIDYAASKGLAGAMIWSVNMDYNNELLEVVRSFKTTVAARKRNADAAVPASSPPAAAATAVDM